MWCHCCTVFCCIFYRECRQNKIYILCRQTIRCTLCLRTWWVCVWFSVSSLILRHRSWIQSIMCCQSVHHFGCLLHAVLICIGHNSTEFPCLQDIFTMMDFSFNFQVLIYTLFWKKVSCLMFDKNFGKCGPIFKILSPGGPCGSQALLL